MSFRLCYVPLDGPRDGRIIKDVMRHQSGEDKERKKRLNRTAEAGSEARNLTPDLSADDDIDPADFFDPEEFGIRRRDIKSIRP